MTAPGYKDGGFSEPPHIGRFDRQVSELRLDRAPYVEPARNRFGAVRSLGTERFPGDSSRIYVTFELLQGARAGARLRLPMPKVQKDWFSAGTRFYLTRSLEEMEAEEGARVMDSSCESADRAARKRGAVERGRPEPERRERPYWADRQRVEGTQGGEWAEARRC